MQEQLEQTPYSQAPEPFLRTLRSLVECHEKVMRLLDRHIEGLGLTPAQFDVIATLGDTDGLTCKQLGQGTLITKGTLTGVLDRLESRGLIKRAKGEQDSRQVFITLTEEGEEVFRQTFQPHIDYAGQFFQAMPLDRQQKLQELLNELHAAFSEP